MILLIIILYIRALSHIIYICKKIFHCRSKERKKYFKMNRSMKGFVFLQRIYVAQGHVNGIHNET